MHVHIVKSTEHLQKHTFFQQPFHPISITELIPFSVTSSSSTAAAATLSRVTFSPWSEFAKNLNLV
jgi:hypothetical protein